MGSLSVGGDVEGGGCVNGDSKWAAMAERNSDIRARNRFSCDNRTVTLAFFTNSVVFRIAYDRHPFGL